MKIEKQEKISVKTGYHHGDLRSQLLEAVRQLIETKGHADFSIAEAARLAGVSSAAPYKHFKDRPAILKALVLLCMERMAEEMNAAIENLPVGSIERVDALGKYYIDFARQEPGMFRLMFGLTEDHANDKELTMAGQNAFGIVVKTAAEFLNISPDDPKALQTAYVLWTFVHGHSFLIIDQKTSNMDIEIDEKVLLRRISKSILVIDK